MYDRPFGVEIECRSAGQGVRGTETLLKNNGFSNWARVCYDGSEVEIKSPVLKGTEGMSELKKVMSFLKSHGYTTTPSDGMHCHFDVSDLNESDMIRVIKDWNANQHIVRKFLGRRFNNHFCRPYNSEELKNIEKPRGLWWYDGNKNHAIEPRSHFRTLEFRQHYGTLEFDEARAWILLCQAFIKSVANRKTEIGRLTTEDLFKRARVYKIAQANLLAR